MRNLSKLAVCLAAAVILAVNAADPSLADPPRGVTPEASDVVGVGAGATQYLLDQLAVNYDSLHKGGTHLYSWDAVNPAAGSAVGQIIAKADCRPIPRPDGSSAGIAALHENIADPSDPKAPCIDYARSSRPPEPTDPPAAPGGVVFIELAGDAITYATRDAASGGTSAPGNLSAVQLKAIYDCQITNWRQVDGRNAPIRAFIPQKGSGTRASFLAALRLKAPGSCVSDESTRALPGGALAENEGVNPVLDNPNAVVPYSVAAYIAQVYHSAACHPAGCAGSPACRPTGKQNLFGCDQHGVLGLNKINGTAPFTPWPPPRQCPQCQINPKFATVFQYILSDVVRYSRSGADHIPPYLAPIFGPDGYLCSPQAEPYLRNYGFLPLPKGNSEGNSESPECSMAYP